MDQVLPIALANASEHTHVKAHAQEVISFLHGVLEGVLASKVEENKLEDLAHQYCKDCKQLIRGIPVLDQEDAYHFGCHLRLQESQQPAQKTAKTK